MEHPPPAKTDGTNRRIEEELALKHNELRSTNSLTLAILGQSCRAASLLLLTAFVPFSADADDGRKALRIAGCGEGVIDAFLREGKKAAIMQAQEKRNFSCIRAVMRLKDKHKIPDTEAPIHSEPVPMSQDPNPEPISEFAINAEKKWRDRLNKVRCPTLVEKAARPESDLDLLTDQALEHNNPDCAIFVAEAYRIRGDGDKGDALAKKVIDDYADRAAPTYPLILYYKIAYLGGGESDLSKLKRRQADMHLVDRALGQLFVTRQAELRSFITDPRGKECLNTGMLGSNSAPSWMQDLTKGITRVCQQVEAWEQLVEKRRNSPADSLTPTVSGKELLTALKKVEALYPFPFANGAIDEPRWINNVRIDANCAVSFEQHVTTFLRIEGLQRIPQAGAPALERALAALASRCDRAIDYFKIPKDLAEQRLKAVLDTIGQQSLFAPAANATKVSNPMAINGLLDEIDAQVADDPSALGELPDRWTEQAKPFIEAGVFPEAYRQLLELLRLYKRCEQHHSHVQSEADIPGECQPFSPSMDLSSTDDNGKFLVRWDPQRFQELVRKAHDKAKATPRPRNTESAPSRTRTLHGIVKAISEQDWIDNANQNGLRAFENEVAEQFTMVGYDYATYVSEETRRAVAPNPPWVWVAFADCRLFERRWTDAIENLVIAATKATEENNRTRALIVRRLRRVSEEAKDAGIPEYGPDNLKNMVGSTMSKPPAWLLTKLPDN